MEEDLFYECISVSFISNMYPTKIYFIKASEKKSKYSSIHTLKSLLYGLWGITGFISIFRTLAINERGGVDMTNEVFHYLNNANILNEKNENKKVVLNSIDIENQRF